MKKIACYSILFLVTLFSSCSSTEDETEDNGGLSNNPVSGTLYGNAFTLVGSRGSVSGELITIELSAQSVGCDGTFEDFPISIYTPNAVGTYTTNVSVSFEDPNSSDFVSVSGGITVEIQSIGNTIVGRVKAASVSTDNTINGKFTVPVCQ